MAKDSMHITDAHENSDGSNFSAALLMLKLSYTLFLIEFLEMICL